MTEQTNHFLICEDCGIQNESVDIEFCPYHQDIYGEFIEVKLCPFCYKERINDI